MKRSPDIVKKRYYPGCSGKTSSTPMTCLSPLKEDEKVRSAPSTGYGEIDFRLIRKDGRIKWVHGIYQKIQGKDGEPEYYEGAIYDVTERRETRKVSCKYRNCP